MSIYCVCSMVNNLEPTPQIQMIFTITKGVELSDREQKEIYQTLNSIQLEENFDESTRPFTYNSVWFDITYTEDGILHKWTLNGRVISHIVYHDEGRKMYGKFDDNAEVFAAFYKYLDVEI